MQTAVTKKTLLLSLLLLVTGSAWAEWVKTATTDEKTFYIDRATIRKDGNLRKVWEITDFKKRDSDGVMSNRARAEYACKGERRRLLSISTHSELMAGGKLLFIHQYNDEDWIDIPPDTIFEKTLKIVCAQ